MFLLQESSTNSNRSSKKLSPHYNVLQYPRCDNNQLTNHCGCLKLIKGTTYAKQHRSR